MERKYWFLMTITPLFLALDQGTKLAVQSRMYLGQRIEVIAGFFDIHFVSNKGMLFSLLTDLNDKVRVPLLVGLALVAIMIILYLYHKAPRERILLPLALAFILSGALGNLADRLRLSYVVDFIDFYWRGLHGPVFNFADIAIAIGIVALIIDTIFLHAESDECDTEETREADETIVAQLDGIEQ